jgi:hypothetical protein
MKRLLIICVIIACMAVVAFASVKGNKKSTGSKTEKQEQKKKKDCDRVCPFS